MSLTKNDIGLLFAMVVTVVGMTFVLPALGMGGDRITENEMPGFNITTDRFGFAGEFPDSPGSPSSGELWYQEDLGGSSDNALIITNDEENTVSLFNDGNLSDPAADITVFHAPSATDEYLLENVSDRVTHQNNSYTIEFVFEEIQRLNESDMRIVVSWEITSQPEDTGWLGRIPLVGGIISVGSQLASVVGWIGGVLFWGIGTGISIILNLFGITFDVILFFVGLIHFIGINYSAVVIAAPGWSSIVALFPGLILSLTLGKVIIAVIDVLWIG